MAAICYGTAVTRRPMSENESTNVAIACQGGGSHTAFTAGVLKGLLREWNNDELVGLAALPVAHSVRSPRGTACSAPALTARPTCWMMSGATSPRPTLEFQSMSRSLALAPPTAQFPIPEVSPYAVPGNARTRSESGDARPTHRLRRLRLAPDATPTHVTIGRLTSTAVSTKPSSDDAITPETVLAPPRIRCCTRPSRCTTTGTGTACSREPQSRSPTASGHARALGRAVEDGLDIRGVPTSFASRELAREEGIPLVAVDEVETIDVAIDGAANSPTNTDTSRSDTCDSPGSTLRLRRWTVTRGSSRTCSNAASARPTTS